MPVAQRYFSANSDYGLLYLLIGPHCFLITPQPRTQQFFVSIWLLRDMKIQVWGLTGLLRAWNGPFGLSIIKTFREKGRGLCWVWNDSFPSLSQFIKIFTSLGWRERVKYFPNSGPPRVIPLCPLAPHGSHWDLKYSWVIPSIPSPHSSFLSA